MTDLEKLAQEVSARIHKNMERRFGYEADFENEQDTAAYIHAIITNPTVVAEAYGYHRLQGRIEGLEEAAVECNRQLVPIRIPVGEWESGAANMAFCIGQAIRARIKELKGE